MPIEEQVEEVEETTEETAEEVEETEAETEEVEETSEDASDEGDDSEDSEDVDFACGSDKKKKYAEEDKKKKAGTKNSLESEDMQAEFEAMKKELEELREFKLQQENLKKEALINKYFMLSDEDKADVMAHKTEYSYEEIEEKLALAYVRKNVDFTTIDGEVEQEEESPITTFSLDNQSAGFVPPMVEALRQVKENNF